MNNSLKRLLSFALAVIMCFSMLPVSALAEEPEAGEQAGQSGNTAVEEQEVSIENSAGNGEPIEDSIGELKFIDSTNKSAQCSVSASVSAATAAGGCNVVYYLGLTAKINLSDESTYIRKDSIKDITEETGLTSIDFDIPGLIPNVYYYIVAAIENSSGTVMQTNSKSPLSFSTEDNSEGIAEINTGDEKTLNGKEYNVFSFTAGATGTYAFHMSGGECSTAAYKTDGSVISCTVAEDKGGSGNTRYVEINKGDTIYLYAYGSEEGEDKYTLECFAAVNSAEVQAEGIIPTNKSATIPVTVSVTPGAAAKGCRLVCYYGLNENVNPLDEASYAGNAATEVAGPVQKETINIEINKLVPDVQYYFKVALTDKDGNLLTEIEEEAGNFKTLTGTSGFNEVSQNIPATFNGGVLSGFVFTPSSWGVCDLHITGADCESCICCIYNESGEAISSTEVSKSSDELILSVSVSDVQPVFIYVKGTEEGENNYSLTVEETVYNSEEELRERIEGLRETGGTVELNNDLTITSDLEIPAGVTLRLAGGTLTVLKGKRLTIAETGCIKVSGGSLVVNGVLANNGTLEREQDATGIIKITQKTNYIDNGTVYKYIDDLDAETEKDETVQNIDKAKITAKRNITTTVELERFCEACKDYKKMLAIVDSLEIAADTSLPSKCCLKVIGTLTVPSGKKLTVGDGSELNVCENAALDIKGTVKSTGTISTSVNAYGETGLINIESGGYLESKGSTVNYGIIRVLSGTSEIKVNEDNYTCSEDRRCIEIIGPAQPKDKNLNGLGEDKCALVLSAAGMTELNDCLETKDWSCVNIKLEFDEISEDVIIKSGFILTVPEGETVKLCSGNEIAIARNAGINLENGAAFENCGEVFVFGNVTNSGRNTGVINSGSIRLRDDGEISSCIGVTGTPAVKDTCLLMGSNYVYSDWEAYSLTAPADGWYLFTLSKGNLSGFSYCVIRDGEYISGGVIEDTDSLSCELNKGDELQFYYLSSATGNSELFRLAITEPAGKDFEVETLNAVCGNAFADVSLEFSAPADNTGYEYGVFYAPYESSMTGGYEWLSYNCRHAAGNESQAPASDQTATIKSVQIIPGTEYMYEAYIVFTNGEGEPEYIYGGLKTFNSKAIDDKGYNTFTELELGETITPNGYAYYFDIPQDSDDMYVFTLNGYAEMNVYNGSGYLQEKYINNYGKQVASVKRSLKSGRVFIYVNAGEDEYCTLTVSVKKHDDILENNQLASYVNANITKYEFYRYDVPVSGEYNFSTGNGASIWYYCTGARGEYGWQNYGDKFDITASKGEIIYLLLDENDEIIIRRYDDAGERRVTTAGELIDILHNGDVAACIVEGNITLPLPAAQKEYTYITSLNIIIPNGSSITVPNGVTLESYGRIDINKGGGLTVDRGGCLENCSEVNISGGLGIEKTGELINKGVINLSGGEIDCDGDCCNEDGEINIDCGSCTGNPRDAIAGIVDYSRVNFNKSVSNAKEAAEFFELGKEKGFFPIAQLETLTLDDNLLVPYNGAIELAENAVLTIPAGTTLTADGDIYLNSGAVIQNYGTLKIYNYISAKTTPAIANNGKIYATSNCGYDVSSAVTGAEIEEIIQVSGIATASPDDLIECMKYGDVSVVESITLPKGNYLQNHEIEITNGAELTFAKNAVLESKDRIVIDDGVLDITADDAELDKTNECVEIFGDNAAFYAGKNFITGTDSFGVLYYPHKDALKDHTDLSKAEITCYCEANDFDELKNAISSSAGWKYVLIECKGVALTSGNCPADAPLEIPENVVLQVSEGGELSIESGAYVNNSGRISVDGSGENELLKIEEGSHVVNKGEGGIIAEVPGTASGLKNISDGLTIENCVMYRSEEGNSYWRYEGPDGENCAYAKTVFKTNKKVVWAMDKSYSTYATLSGKKDTMTATLTPKTLKTVQTVEFTATYGAHTAHIQVTFKPTATKISIYGENGNVSGKTVNISIEDTITPFEISILPETAHYDVTATSKNKDFCIIKADEYIVLFKDEDDYDDFMRTYDKEYITAAVLLYDGGGELYVFRPEACIDEDTGAGKTFTLTAASGRLKSYVNICFVECGDQIVTDFDTDITGGDKLTLSAYFENKSQSDTIAWELKDDESKSFASVKTSKGVTTLTSKKVSANTTVRARAYSVTDPTNYIDVEIVLHPAATSARLINSQGEFIADKSKIVTTGDGYELHSTLMPSYDTYMSDNWYESYALWDKVVFSSSNEKVIEVEQDNPESEKATLTFVGTGTATVTVSYKNAANKVIKSSSVTFTKINPVTIALTPENPTIYAGKELLIKAELSPSTYAANKLVWSIEEEELEDWVTLKPSGAKCTVSVKTGCEKATCHLIVKSSETNEICKRMTVYIRPKVNSLLFYAKFSDAGISFENITGRSYVINTGDEVSIERVCFYDESGNKTVINKGDNSWDDIVWKSSAVRTATVENGLVTAVAKGTSKISASYNGMVGEFTVNAGSFADEIEIKPAKDTPVVSGKSMTLAAYNRETGKKVSAAFSIVYGSEYATVTTSGTLKAASGLAGRAWVTVKAVCKDAKAAVTYKAIELVPATAEIVIRTKLEESDGQYSSGKTLSLNITKNSDDDYVHDKVQLEVCQYPADSYYNPKYTVPKGVTMDAQGYLTFSKPGTYTIKVTAGDGSGKSTQVKFNVQRAVDTIETYYVVSGEKQYGSASVVHGKYITLKAELNGGVKAEAPKNTKVTWSLLDKSDDRYCTLTSAGKFTANSNAAGRTVTVVATAQDNGLKDIITVTIT